MQILKKTYRVTRIKQQCLLILKTASGSAIFGTTTISQGTTRNIAGRQIQPVGKQHW
jgi:hypothetical protein